MITLADADPASWDKFMGGQVGFALGIVVSATFFVRFLLPRWDSTTQAIRELTTAINTLVMQNTNKADEKFDAIMEKLEEKNEEPKTHPSH